jgi:multidrug efflux pump subunit AcrA (membrane-fusion protein)
MKKNTLKILMAMLFITTLTALGFKLFPLSSEEKGGNTEQKDKQESPLKNSASESPKKVDAFTVKIDTLVVVLDGLIGTVKGDTLELTFGNQEEKMIQSHVALGQPVQKGQTLFELDHTRALSRKEQASIALVRAKELYDVGGATLHEVKEALAIYQIAKKDYEDTFIYAPKKGTVSAIYKHPGETVSRNEVIASFVSTDQKLYVETSVIEGYIEQVQKDQKVIVTLEALGTKEVEATVMGVSREVTVTGRAGTVHITLPSSIVPFLRPGLSCQCKIFIFDKPVVMIPHTAYENATQSVYLIDSTESGGKGGRVKAQNVRLGHVGLEHYEVLDGLAVDQKIVKDLTISPVKDGEHVHVDF